MTIEMRKIGAILNSRPAGREALLAIQPGIAGGKAGEELVIDFLGVNVLTPSFADEFVTPLIARFRENGIRLTHTRENVTVRKTLAFLAEEWGKGIVIE